MPPGLSFACGTTGFWEASVVPSDMPLSDMAQPLARAKHYRHRAKELRTVASESRDDRTRVDLVSVAKQYEHMAERLEKQAQNKTRS